MPKQAPEQAPALPTIAITGPTASGKTAAALALAQHAQQHFGLQAEIISVDSALVYRGMDIGSAKPSAAERATAPHHLLDIIDPLQSYSAAQFAHDASTLIAAIRARGNLPLLAGGTMLYFKALFEGLSDLPSTPPHIRARVASQAAQIGWPAMHAQLAQIDPATAARLAPNDSQRIGRALEVWHITGQAISRLHQHSSAQQPPQPPALLISLEPESRAWLHQRIEQRFDAMLAAGFIDEIHTLRQRGDLHADLPSIRCVGYRQAWLALDAGTPLAIWREQAIAATRQLAKRQLTWLRSMPTRHTIACDGASPIAQVLQAANKLLAKQPC